MRLNSNIDKPFPVYEDLAGGEARLQAALIRHEA